MEEWFPGLGDREGDGLQGVRMWVDENVLYYAYGNGYMIVCICQNSSNSAFKLGNFFLNKFIYLFVFIFGCVRSSLLCMGFL